MKARSISAKYLLISGLIIIGVFCVLVLLFRPGISDVTSARAWWAWKQNPSEETFQQWLIESKRVQTYGTVFDIVIACTVIFNLFAIRRVTKGYWWNRSDSENLTKSRI